MLSRTRADRLSKEIGETLKEYVCRVEAEAEFEGDEGPALVFRRADGSVIPTAGKKHDAEAVDALNFLATVDQLIHEGGYTEPQVDLRDPATYNSPRHMLGVKLAGLLAHFGYDQLVEERMHMSRRVLARRLIDSAVEELAKDAYEQGCADGQEGSDRNFDRWWLNHG